MTLTFSYNKSMEKDLDYVLTFKKECRKDEDFFDMNPKAWDYVKELCAKHGWNFWTL